MKRTRILLAIAAVALLLLSILCYLWQSVPSLPGELKSSPQIQVLDPSGNPMEVEMEEFLLGVVAAEMPASFELEALKAQAVAARTYLLCHIPPYGTPKHGEAAVCCDSSCCQAWYDQETMEEIWGEQYVFYAARILAAVESTFGQVLFYGNAPAETPFCSTCGGSTEAASACWGNEVPYLQAVECSWCRHSPSFCSYQALSLTEGAALLGVEQESLADMYVDSFTPGGRVASLCLGELHLPGTEIRSLFQLKSAAFSWLIVGETLVFSSVGYGHGVGLCQYGADGMAKEGYEYTQILSYYYIGTELVELDYETW